jgi:hypothetical protein
MKWSLESVSSEHAPATGPELRPALPCAPRLTSGLAIPFAVVYLANITCRLTMCGSIWAIV